MVKEHNVDHQRLSGLTSTYTPSHISIDPLGFYLCPEHFLNFLSNLYIPPRFGKSFRIYGVQIIEKCI